MKEKVDGRKSTSPSLSPKPSRHQLIAEAPNQRDPSPHKTALQHKAAPAAPYVAQHSSSALVAEDGGTAGLQKPAPLLTSPSKTAVAVEKMKQKREERRRKQAEVKKMKEGLSDGDIEVVMFNQILTDFRKRIGYDPKKAATKTQPEPVKDVRIRVCIRKRPLFNKGNASSLLYDGLYH